MYYGNIKLHDIADGPGTRVSLFVSGCRHHCKGCFQPETWDFHYGQEFTDNVETLIIDSLSPGYIHGLTILGGEPFEPENQKCVYSLVSKTKQIYPQKDIWIYSGYTFGQLLDPKMHCNTKYTKNILELTDILVDGEFDINKKNISLQFRGSENQRIIDTRKSLSSDKIVQWNELMR